MAASTAESNVPNPEFIEALVIVRGLQLYMHHEISNRIIESNCLLLVEELNYDETLNSALGNLLSNIRELMSHFLNCKIQHA